MDARIHKLHQFMDSVEKLVLDSDAFRDMPDLFRFESNIYDSLRHLTRQLSRLIEGRLNQLKSGPGSDASPEVAALKYTKRQLLLPSIPTPADNYGTESDVPAFVNDLCSSNDFGTAYSALQIHAQSFSATDYIEKHAEIFTRLSLRVANLPAVLGVDIPKDILDYPIIFQKGVWSKVLWFPLSKTSNLPPGFVHQDCTRSTILHSLAESGRDLGSSGEWEGIFADIDPNQQDFSGRTALHIAAEQKCTPLVACLITKRADLELATVFGHTPLHYAALFGCTEACDLLLKAGANANAADLRGGTPFFYAAAHGHEATVQLFLGWPETDLTIDYDLSRCPLWAALEYGHESVALVIMSRTNWKREVSMRKYRGTALHLAVSSGSLRVASMIIEEMGCEVNAMDDTPALSLAVELGNFQMVQLILAHPDVDVGLVDEWNRTPLHIAAIYGRLEIATALAARRDSQLLKRLVDPPCIPGHRDGMTAYELALKGQHFKVAEMLNCFMSLSAK